MDTATDGTGTAVSSRPGKSAGTATATGGAWGRSSNFVRMGIMMVTARSRHRMIGVMLTRNGGRTRKTFLLTFSHSFNIIKEKAWRARRRYSHLQQRTTWLTTATKKRPEINKPGNRQEIRDPTDHIREVPIGATEKIRIVCKETLQSLVTRFTNKELKIKVIGSPERQRQ
jgi:hypothetical protein